MKHKIAALHLSRSPVGSTFRWLVIAVFCLTAVITFGCAGSMSPGPVQVEAKAPEVSYQFDTDEDLIEANSRARTYCSQYASTAIMEGRITTNQDGTKTVTFQCVQNAVNMPATPPETYAYRNDNDLLQAMQSAEAYCARRNQVASFNVTTNAGGTQTLTYRCVPR